MVVVNYLHMQLRLEGKSVSGGDFLRQAEVVPDEDMPLMILVQFTDKQVVAYYDEAMAPELHTTLEKRFANIRFPSIDTLLDFLPSQNTSYEVGHYKTYLFPAHLADFVNRDVFCLSKQEPFVQAFGFSDFAENVYVVEQNGRIASACVSVRENEQCGEAWVYTDPHYRNHGFAQHVVKAWAQSMINAGKVPFYSHKIENIVSTNLANRLGLQPVFEEISISYSNV